MRRLLALSLALAGCSIVNDPGMHQGDAGTGMDAGTEDAGDVDAGAPDAGEADAGMPDAGPPTVAIEDVCDELATAYCAAAPMCCTDMAADFTNCEMRIRDQCLAIYDPANIPGRLVYDPVRAAEMVAEGTELVQTCNFAGLSDWYTRTDGFFRGLTGTIAGGESCDPAGSDQSDYIYAVLSCADEGQICRPNDASLMEWSCRSLGNDGSTCTYGLECVNGRCERPSVLSLRGTCGRGESDGERCVALDECESLACIGPGTNPIFRVWSCEPLEANTIFCQYPEP